MTNLERQHLNTIYASSDVFDKLSGVSQAIKIKGAAHIYVRGVRIVKDDKLEANSMITLDPEMVKRAKEMEGK